MTMHMPTCIIHGIGGVCQPNQAGFFQAQGQHMFDATTYVGDEIFSGQVCHVFNATTTFGYTTAYISISTQTPVSLYSYIHVPVVNETVESYQEFIQFNRVDKFDITAPTFVVPKYCKTS